MMKRCLAALACLLVLFSFASAEEPDRDVLLSYYDGCVLFGDSVSLGLRQYRSAAKQRKDGLLDGLTMVCTTSIGLYAASRRYPTGTYHFKYKGTKYTLYEIVRLLKPPRIFILLGLNDEVGLKIDKALEWVKYLIRYIPEYSADTEVCFLSVTPVTRKYCRSVGRNDYQELLDEYNRRLRETCLELGASYMEIAEPLKDEDGCLAARYTVDDLVHLNDRGFEVWIQSMCGHARAQLEAGLWTPDAGE